MARSLLAIFASVILVVFASACSSSGGSTPQPVATPGPDVSVGFNTAKPSTAVFSATPNVSDATTASFTLSESNSGIVYTGAFTLAPTPGNAACVVLTGTNPYSVNAAACTGTSSGVYTVTDSGGNTVNMVVNFISPSL